MMAIAITVMPRQVARLRLHMLKLRMLRLRMLRLHMLRLRSQQGRAARVRLPARARCRRLNKHPFG